MPLEEHDQRSQLFSLEVLLHLNDDEAVQKFVAYVRDEVDEAKSDLEKVGTVIDKTVQRSFWDEASNR